METRARGGGGAECWGRAVWKWKMTYISVYINDLLLFAISHLIKQIGLVDKKIVQNDSQMIQNGSK